MKYYRYYKVAYDNLYSKGFSHGFLGASLLCCFVGYGGNRQIEALHKEYEDLLLARIKVLESRQ
jgi:hypothetical protein